jgi:BirA family biotin operon repressor/biotin-[acetyl-CoA-carboxylase] ligase
MRGSPYADLTRPPLRAADLRRALVTGGLWTDLRVVAETGSTNADLAAQARAGAGEGRVLVAESQTAGRGRLARQWEAPPQSSIMVSVLLYPPVPPSRLGWLPMLAGVAVAESVGRLAVVDARLKWPNDLLVRPAVGEAGYGKCAGVLAEAVGDAVVVGIGLNVLQRADEVPPRVGSAFPATSLALSGAACIDRDPLLRALLRSLADWYVRWRTAGGDPEASGVREAYRAYCLTLGTEVRVTLPGGEVVAGLASDVDADGRLVVTTAAGVRSLAAGDVEHVRPENIQDPRVEPRA